MENVCLLLSSFFSSETTGGAMKKDLFQRAALSMLNIPYRWGGDDPMWGFDCSGLVEELLNVIGCKPPGRQTAQGLYNIFLNQTQAPSSKIRDIGTLAFFGTSVAAITHVALLIDSETMIEAGGGDHTTVSQEVAATQNAFVKLRPVSHRQDLVALLRPLRIDLKLE